jgi:hypothetical protein
MYRKAKAARWLVVGGQRKKGSWYRRSRCCCSSWASSSWWCRPSCPPHCLRSSLEYGHRWKRLPWKISVQGFLPRQSIHLQPCDLFGPGGRRHDHHRVLPRHQDPGLLLPRSSLCSSRSGYACFTTLRYACLTDTRTVTRAGIMGVMMASRLPATLPAPRRRAGTPLALPLLSARV